MNKKGNPKNRGGTGRPPKTAEEKRTEQILYYLKPSEMEEVKEFSRLTGMSPNEAGRYALLQCVREYPVRMAQTLAAITTAIQQKKVEESV